MDARWVIACGWLTAVGCKFTPPPGTEPPGDGSLDVQGDGSLPCEWATRAGHFSPCEAPMGAAWRVNRDVTIDTTDGTVDTGLPPTSYLFPGLQLLVVSVAQFEIAPSAILRAVGPNALAIVSWDTATIEGQIDVSSHHVLGGGYSLGAGAVEQAGGLCHLGGDGDNGGGQDRGGGGGGGFGALGGAGGNGAGNHAGGVAGAAIVGDPVRIAVGVAAASGATVPTLPPAWGDRAVVLSRSWRARRSRSDRSQ